MVEAEKEIALWEAFKKGKIELAARIIEEEARQRDAYIDEVKARGKGVIMETKGGTKTKVMWENGRYVMRIVPGDRYIWKGDAKKAARILEMQLRGIYENLKEIKLKNVKCFTGDEVQPPLAEEPQKTVFCVIDAETDSLRKVIQTHDMADAWVALAMHEVYRQLDHQ